MYMAETTNGSHTLVFHPSEDGNLVQLSIFTGRFPKTEAPAETFLFSVREATDLMRAVEEAIEQTIKGDGNK